MPAKASDNNLALFAGRGVVIVSPPRGSRLPSIFLCLPSVELGRCGTCDPGRSVATCILVHATQVAPRERLDTARRLNLLEFSMRVGSGWSVQWRLLQRDAHTHGLAWQWSVVR